MNFSQDALWWRLKNQHVRDLAMLLTAPALWDSHRELPVKTLLGNEGFRCLLAWDDEPSALLEHLQKEAPFAYRLGFYAESLLAFWFSHAPHATLYAQNVQLFAKNSKQTQGAIDFLVSLNGDVYHLELTCKYYGAEQALVSHLAGMNQQDTLVKKAAKLQQQLDLSLDSHYRECILQAASLDEGTQIHQASIVRGMYFTIDAKIPKDDAMCHFNPDAWQGCWIPSWSLWQKTQEQMEHENQQQKRWMWLSKAQLLSAVRVGKQETFAWQEIDWLGEANWLVALEERVDGYWHEQARFMVMAA